MTHTTSSQYFDEIARLVKADGWTMRECYSRAYRLFVELLDERTANSGQTFAGPFARMHYLCRKHGVKPGFYGRLNCFRCRCRELTKRTDQELQQAWLTDVRLLADFTSAVVGEALPLLLRKVLPESLGQEVPEHVAERQCVRVIVMAFDDEVVHVCRADADATVLRLAYLSADGSRDWNYLRPLLRVGTQLNILNPCEVDGAWWAEQIIFEPDYLVDITSVARCFETYGHTPYAFLINKLRPVANSYHILLGNLAGQFLDEAVYGVNAKYEDSISDFFRHSALNLAACSSLDRSFHEEARRQQCNLRELAAGVLATEVGVRPERVLLEPSFFCESIGVQGRMDLILDDMTVLIEQKSGKKDFRTGRQQLQHYVQVLLYLAVLHYGFGRSYSKVSPYLLYSKYPGAEGLLRLGNAPQLLHEALALRNQLVWNELQFANGGVGQVLDQLTPHHLHTASDDAALWGRYTLPQLMEVFAPIAQASALEKSYFYRFFTFLSREHFLAKMGTAGREASGFASAWLCSLDEKRQAGSIFCGLQMQQLCHSADGKGICAVVLSVPDDAESYLPRFREGDIVVLHAYKEGTEPDLRSTLAFRCHFRQFRKRCVRLDFNNPQKNERVLRRADSFRWAIEADFMESANASLFRGLMAFLAGDAERRRLLLGLVAPRINQQRQLLGDYSARGGAETNDFVLRAKQADDFFLLVGPPGTGKTSVGLMSILQEQLAEEGTSVLLSAFTNRAVDEICSKLVGAGIDFVRIGSAFNCGESYVPYLLEQRVAQLRNVAEVRGLLQKVRVVVGTTAALGGRPQLFCLKRFDLAIIDEASQLLEPHLLPLLMASGPWGTAIGRFVLIGDHKQLPAVVSQSEDESRVDDEALRAIGLTDCRRSLFERLLGLHRGNKALIHVLTRQGRMHPEVMRIPSEYFYGSSLRPLGLPHQTGEWLTAATSLDDLQDILARHRVLFFECKPTDERMCDKMNTAEAQFIARIVGAVYGLYVDNGRVFSAQKSVGVIVPYRHQVALVRKEFDALCLDALDEVTIDTVERFQGSERDVVVYGFTVQRPKQLDFLCSSQFVEDGNLIDRKLNVVLTRAREQMVMVGNSEVLQQDAVFSHLLQSVRKEGGYVAEL